MKRKPDVMLTLFAIFCLSLVISGYTTLTQETSVRQARLVSEHYSAIVPEALAPREATP
ncbi:MAG: hypothetical protein IPM37_11495 [Hahellaceae bacterium]|nr:hypothetical protein [Hahellaceae bacterium]